MTVDTLRTICRTLPDVTEDIKWGHDLCFCVAGKMFTVVDLERPHSVAFKCTPESFGELTERPGIIPAPYMARNMWVQEQELGEALDRHELESLVRTSYELVVSTLPKSKRPGAEPSGAAKKSKPRKMKAKKAATRRASARKKAAKPPRRAAR
jgi:predicted DNA-binding protein (MmcQ/YjbR family)